MNYSDIYLRKCNVFKVRNSYIRTSDVWYYAFPIIFHCFSKVLFVNIEPLLALSVCCAKYNYEERILLAACHLKCVLIWFNENVKVLSGDNVTVTKISVTLVFRTSINILFLLHII